MPKRRGRKSAAQTPAPPKERIRGSKVNPKGSASSESEAEAIRLSPQIEKALKAKLREFKKKHPNVKSVTINDLKASYRRGLGAYSKTHRPTIKGGVPNTRNAWAMARVNAFLKKAAGEKVKKSYVQDDDLLKMEGGGSILLAPNGRRSNLTPEQYKLVRTPQFKAWFGDWENDSKNASKVVDENGEPKVMWHGSNVMDEINVFKSSKGFDYSFFSEDRYESFRYVLDYERAFPNEKPNQEKRNAYYDKKIKPFFINARNVFDYNKLNDNEIQVTNKFLQDNKDELYEVILKMIKDMGTNLKYYLEELDLEEVISKIELIKYFISKSSDDWWLLETKPFQKFIKENNYDSFVTNESGVWNIAVYKPNQIKLADGTNTTFDGSNPDIRFEDGGKVQELIRDGIVEIKMFDTTNEHSKEYGFDAQNPLYIQSIIVSKEHRGKGIGSKVFEYIVEYAKENKHDLIFGHITQKAEPSIDSIKSILNKSGFNTIDGNNDFYKIIDIKYEDGGTTLLAPNGEPSKLTPEQYKLVRTPEFKAWFGDWENDPKNASKVVDENGEPLVVYHGTKKVFTKFYENKYLGGDADSLNFFTTNYKTAVSDYDGWITYPCFIKIINPLKELYGTPEKSILLENSKGLKTDGFIHSWGVLQKPLTDRETWIAVPKSNQIKLASKPIIKPTIKNKKFIEKVEKTFINNFNTTFDGSNPDIRFEKGGEVDSFYKWFINWYKVVKDDITMMISVPNELRPFKEKGAVILEVFEKKNLSVDAKEYLKEILKKADEYGVTIILEPTPRTHKIKDKNYKEKITKEYLTNYYEKFGFESTENYMVRYPKTKMKRGGVMNQGLKSSVDTVGNVDSDPLDPEKDIEGDGEGIFKEGGELKDNDKKETYSKWKDLINMSKSELKKFYNSKEGKEAGITVETASKLGISRGRTSAKWIMKMKDTPVAKWTPEMWKWAKKQISFVSRMRGNKGDLYDDKGKKTRKHTSLLIWGHNPEKYNTGGMTNKKLNLEGYYAKGGEPKTCEIIRNGVRQIDPESIEKLTDCVMRLPQTKSMHVDKNGNYTPERKELHKKIIYDIKKDLTCVQRTEPIAILMGGSPASGKSTFLKKYRPYLLSEEILKVDADEVRAKLPEYKGWNATQTHLETKDIVNLLLSDRNIGIPCAFDLIYDGTMNSTKSYLPLIKLLKSLGYKVFIVYIDRVDKEVVIDRALKRYQKSGRFVPLEVIDDFFSKGTAALESLKSEVDGYMVVDGSSSDYKVIDKGGIQLPKDRKYSKIGTPIQVTEKEVVMEYKDGGRINFNPDGKSLKGMVTHKSGAAGGMLVGKRHSEGGIKAINKSTGQPLEMEGGEVVITRDAVSDDTKREFEGKMMTNREILSAINESGGGVSFADGGDVHECGCTGKTYKYGGKSMTDFDIVMEMKKQYPDDFKKGKSEELSEHRGTFQKLRRKGLTASQAAELVVAEHLKKKPDYYKNYKDGGVLDVLGKNIPSMPTFLKMSPPVLSPFKNAITYYYPLKNNITGIVHFAEGGHVRGRKISDFLAYKTYIYDNFDINFSELPVRLQNALTLGNQKMIDDYLKE